MRQVCVETSILAACGGALGLALTSWTMPRWADAMASRYLALDYTLNRSTVVYAAVVSVSVAALCALPPSSGSGS